VIPCPLKVCFEFVHFFIGLSLMEMDDYEFYISLDNRSERELYFITDEIDRILEEREDRDLTREEHTMSIRLNVMDDEPLREIRARALFIYQQRVSTEDEYIHYPFIEDVITNRSVDAFIECITRAMDDVRGIDDDPYYEGLRLIINMAGSSDLLGDRVLLRAYLHDTLDGNMVSEYTLNALLGEDGWEDVMDIDELVNLLSDVRIDDNISVYRNVLDTISEQTDEDEFTHSGRTLNGMQDVIHQYHDMDSRFIHRVWDLISNIYNNGSDTVNAKVYAFASHFIQCIASSPIDRPSPPSSPQYPHTPKLTISPRGKHYTDYVPEYIIQPV
jgi:hypothetical protein